MEADIRRPSREAHHRHRPDPAGDRRHGGRIRRLDLEPVTQELRHRLGLLEARLAELGGCLHTRVRSSYLR